MNSPEPRPLATAIVTPTQSALSPASDLTGYSTFALAVVTVALAVAAFIQAYLSRKAIDATKQQDARAFLADRLRQTEAATPIIVAEASPRRSGDYRYLALRNVGSGAAIKVRFSGIPDGAADFSAAQHGISAIGAGGLVTTRLALSRNHEGRDVVNELFIRYDDVFGNTYSTEYARFADDSEWYAWRRPWLGEELGMSRPVDWSGEGPEWGFRGRIYYNAEKGLW